MQIISRAFLVRLMPDFFYLPSSKEIGHELRKKPVVASWIVLGIHDVHFYGCALATQST
jgi:hypothetical protein